jgi:hypothetical protein
MIRYEKAAIRLVEILYNKLIRMDVHPIQRLLLTPDMEKSFYAEANTRQLQFIPPGEEELHNRLNGSIVILAPESLMNLKDIDPGRIAKPLKSRKFLRDILEKREEDGAFSWTLAIYPTEELAHHAGLDLKTYAAQVATACYLNRTDPVAQWDTVFRKANALKKKLNALQVEKFHIESDHVDLEITPGSRRKWIGISGHNIPSFELFVSRTGAAPEAFILPTSHPIAPATTSKASAWSSRTALRSAPKPNRERLFSKNSFPWIPGPIKSANFLSPINPFPKSTGSWPIPCMMKISEAAGATVISRWGLLIRILSGATPQN